jgi:hypothetical protein
MSRISKNIKGKCICIEGKNLFENINEKIFFYFTVI